MKKVILILTFTFYIFSIFTEAGFFNSHAEVTSSTIYKKLISEELEISDTISSQSASQESHCAKDVCHIGHCHHTSTLENLNIKPTSSRLSKYNLSILTVPLNPFLDGLKRPPRNS